MANTSQEVYHCPSCGALAPPGMGAEGQRICAACGLALETAMRPATRSASSSAVSAGGFVQRDVSSRRRESERVGRVERVAPAEADAGEGEQGEGRRRRREEVVSDDGQRKVVRRKRRRKRTNLTPVLLICGWAVAVLLVIIVMRYHGLANDEGEEGADSEAEQLQRARGRAMDVFLEENHASCREALDAFLQTGSAVSRTQHVRDPGRLAPVMEEYYKGTLPWTLPPEGRLETKAINMFIRGERRAYELVLGVEGTEEPYPDQEVAMVRQNGRWLVEWESFVRYSSEPWSLFVEQLGDPEGVFRVYLRVSAVEAEGVQDVLSVQFLPPRSDAKLWEQDSEFVKVPRDSEAGRRIVAIIAAAKEPWELGDSIFGKTDPKELYRVRVTLAWEGKEDGGTALVLREVHAGNWYGPGFEDDFSAVGDHTPGDAGDAGTSSPGEQESAREAPDSAEAP